MKVLELAKRAAVRARLEDFIAVSGKSGTLLIIYPSSERHVSQDLNLQW
jgi:hypothetical protein